MLDSVKNSIYKSTGRGKNYLRSVLFNIFDWFYTNAFWGLLQRVDRKFIKFLFVGLINTIFGYSMYALFVTFSFDPSHALLISYILGIFWNFKTTGSIVFRNTDNKLIIKFFLAYAFTYSVNNYFLDIFMIDFSMNKYLAEAILIPPIAVLSYCIFNTFIFVKKEK